jgi:hypothetical protein
MYALEKKLADFLPQEMLALLEKIETLEGSDTDYSIAEYINCMPLTKFERFMLVRAYRRFESRQARFKAMELLFPSPKRPTKQENYMYTNTNSGIVNLSNATPKREGGAIAYGPIQKSRVGHI